MPCHELVRRTDIQHRYRAVARAVRELLMRYRLHFGSVDMTVFQSIYSSINYLTMAKLTEATLAGDKVLVF